MTHDGREPEYLAEVSELLDEIIEPDARPVLFLEGGHYNPAIGSSTFSVSSLRSALTVGERVVRRYGKSVRLVFGVLIDDLGCTSANRLGAGPEQLLPTELLDVLLGHRLVKLDRVVLATERNARNRAVDTLKKLCRRAACDALCVIDDADSQRVALRQDFGEDITLGYLGGQTSKVRCPAIMGQHYGDRFLTMKQRFPLSEQLVMLDWSESMDLWKVTGGAKACHELFLRPTLDDTHCEIVNLFFGDDDGQIHELHHESRLLAP